MQKDKTPLWVKLFGGTIAMMVGVAVGLLLALQCVDWYTQHCPVGDCAVEQLIDKL